jgi:hypothetical protein
VVLRRSASGLGARKLVIPLKAREIKNHGTFDHAAEISVVRVAFAQWANAPTAVHWARGLDAPILGDVTCAGPGHGVTVVDGLSGALYWRARAALTASGGWPADGVGRLAAA